MKGFLYTVWGVGVLALLGMAQWNGWSLTQASETKTNPRSVRANPGSYRSPYYGAGHILRGK